MNGFLEMSDDRFVLSVKSSGLSDDSYPISLGIAGQDSLALSWLIYPLEDWNHWDDSSEEAHGITKTKLFSEGRDGFLVCREINAIFNGKSIIVCSDWDNFWIRKLFMSLSVKMSFSLIHLKDFVSKEQIGAFHTKFGTVGCTHAAKDDAQKAYGVLQSLALL